MADTSATRSLHLIVRCLAIAMIADVADRKSAGLRHVVELGCGLLALLCPGVGTLLVLAAACLGVTLLEPFERWYVHHYIAAALHGVVCASALVAVVAARRLPTGPELMALIRAPFRMIAFALFFAGVAKLNRDFLDPRISCAGVYYLWMQEWPLLDSLPDSDSAKRVAITLAVTAELLGPLLLLARRTRPLGLALLWSLTIALCANTHGVYVEFVGLFWVASLLWLEPPVLERAAELLASMAGKLGAPVRVELKLGAALTIALLVEQGRGRGLAAPWLYAWLSPALLVVLAVTAAVLRASLMSHGAREASASNVLSHRLRFVVLLVPLAVLCNEARAYAGWPGKPALRMAANLIITPRETNHLLLARVPRLAFGGPWGLMIEPPYRMKREPVLCGKPEPGFSRDDTMRHMRKRLQQDRLASGG